MDKRVWVDKSITELMPCLSTFKETSFDDDNSQSLIDNVEYDVFNFDKYVEKQFEKTYKSNDVLCWSDSSCKEILFIEFKNGYLKKVRMADIRLKIYDSVMLVSQLFGLSLSEICPKISYILVYNDSKVSIQKNIMARGHNSPEPIWLADRKENLEILKNRVIKDYQILNQNEFAEQYIL